VSPFLESISKKLEPSADGDFLGLEQYDLARSMVWAEGKDVSEPNGCEVEKAGGSWGDGVMLKLEVIGVNTRSVLGFLNDLESFMWVWIQWIIKKLLSQDGCRRAHLFRGRA
jgi:hypothetical protein